MSDFFASTVQKLVDNGTADKVVQKFAKSKVGDVKKLAEGNIGKGGTNFVEKSTLEKLENITQPSTAAATSVAQFFVNAISTTKDGLVELFDALAEVGNTPR